MADLRQTVSVSIDRGELIDTAKDEVLRKAIGKGGALGLWDGFGKITIRVNSTEVVTLHLHEDGDGHVVLDVHDPATRGIAHRAHVEQRGLVPSRFGRRREERT